MIGSQAPAIVVLGPSALGTAERLRSACEGAEIHGFRPRIGDTSAHQRFDEVGGHLRELFASNRPIVALCASAIVIRSLAPLLQDKQTEPPVLAIAEDGSAVIPLLGGHHGANDLARWAAATLGCTAAITTASEIHFGAALDQPPAGWVLANPEVARGVMADLLAGRTVALDLDRIEKPPWLEIPGLEPAAATGHRVLVSDRVVEPDLSTLVVRPRRLALGVGCEQGTPAEEILDLVRWALASAGYAEEALGCLASIDLKSAEPGLVALESAFGLPLRLFSAEELESERPRMANPSPTVFAAVGTHGVAEGAALAAAGPGSDLVVGKTRSPRATCAIARAPGPLAPAHIGRSRGRLVLIGLGPGAAAWRTPEATAWLGASEDWVGYQGYLDLLPERIGSQAPARYGFDLGREEERCRFALEQAGAGRRVALVGSGDVGIYAMAALVFELVERHDTAFGRIEIQISPGISALQAAAARAGAPLGHDFCAISLSDLLTPWSEIERRLQAASAGDFVIALYNPASGRRRVGLERALVILAGGRAPSTPVVHARNLGRAGECVHTLTLGTLDPAAVDMMSILIVGSSRSRRFTAPGGRTFIYTPRGYPIGDLT